MDDSTGAAEAIVEGQAQADLARLYDPDVMLVTAPAAPSAGAMRHAEALSNGALISSTVKVSTPEGVPAEGVLDQLSMVDGVHASAWVSYLEGVVELFASLVGARSVGVRQIVSEGPHCPRFHVDQVAARGVLNLMGPCTEWLHDGNVDRSRLGHAGGTDDATSGLVHSWDLLGRAELGALAVFKGTAWPGAADRAIVHRSPPPDGKRRLVLTLDWLE